MFMMLPMHPLAKPARLIPHLHRDHKEDGDDTARDAGIQWFSPGYEIKQPNSTSSSSDGKYVIRVNVPGIQASDLKVQVLDDGRTLHISGETQRHTALPSDGPDSEPHATTTSSSMSFQFTKYFTIGKNMDLDKMTAHLDKGVLTISAPVREAVSSHGHTIAITEGDLEQKEEQSSAIADGK